LKRFLVTTALQEAWGTGEPVLFLGEWCLIYPQDPHSLGFDAQVMPYHWDDRTKLFGDYKLVSASYENVLSQLSSKLNELHGVDRSIGYWRILIGPWLGLFMLMIFDRWSSIRQAVNAYELSGSIVLTGGEESLVPNDMHDFNILFPGDEWNHYIYGLVLEHFASVPLIRRQRASSAPSRAQLSSLAIKRKLKRHLGQFIAQFGQLWSRENDAVFVAPYLTMWEEVELSVRLGQLPRFLRQAPAISGTVDRGRRNWSLPGRGGVDFDTVVRALIPHQIPCVYLEGYSQLTAGAEALPWPRQPKAIWTSNSFYSDELFKAWAGDKVERGTPLVIGQHGGNYGMGLWSWPEQHEIAISDRYLTWGWSKPSTSKLRPVGKIKYSRPVTKSYEQEYALLVTLMTQRYGNPTLSMYTSSLWLDYLREQFDFVDALPTHVQDRLIVRLSQPDYGWHQVDRWRDRYPLLQIDDGCSNINKLVRQSRLYISTYNATTYLESLSMNMPTVIYWNPRCMETNAWVQPYFDKLRATGIFHETPQSAARHVTRIWDDVSAWWESEDTRTVRDRFVREFAYCPDDKIDRLKNAINEAATVR